MNKMRPLQWIGAVAAALLVALLFSSAALAESTDTEAGVLVLSVAADSPAAQAGLVRGDIILAIDGEALKDAAHLVERIQEAASGDTIVLTVRHGDEESAVDVTLGESGGRAYLGVLPDYGVWGRHGDEMWGRHPHDLYGMTPYTDTAAGALVAEVMEDSPAAAAGLVIGDVILGVDGEKLAAATDLADRVAAHAPGDEVALEVLRVDGGALEDVPVTLGANPDDDTLAYLGVRYLPTPHRMFLGQTDEGEQVVPTPPYHNYGRRPFGHPSFRTPAPFANPHFRFAPPRRWMLDSEDSMDDAMPHWSRRG